ncbi:MULTISPECIES: ParB/RepB/Spo0J family partition protein [unclassified Legionella]|uniref:ParB/RepB/Spo0J family partition protein n=1 Tax=unclassified Legionella TaxID=2622702 RepID=UPI001056DD74|nr:MULTISPECIES: ParB/RepB/Spo0J family partition protein [unclassified Legionella]MDI9819519.1 ParB/RepB/Spo0J family partition protein [Legionella sp. PL877]
MTGKRSGLGRNLSVLLGNAPTALFNEKPVTDSLRLSIHSLQPGKYQPRSEIEEASLAELVSSIKQQGLLQPLVVREISGGCYEIIAGERRWRACQLAGLTEVPVILRQVDDETAMAMALVENLQREDLNAMDQARAMHRLTSEFALTHQQVAELLSKSRAAVSNYLRLLSLTAEVRRLLEHGDLDMGHARALLMLNETQQNQVAQLVVAKNLSVRETEKLVARVKEGRPALIAHKPEINPRIHQQLQTLAEQLNAKVNIRPGKAGKGRLVIHYETDQGLQAVIQQLTRGR